VCGVGGSYYNYYFFKDWDEGKVLDYVDVSITKVIESDEEPPNIKRYQTIYYREFYLFRFTNKVLNYNELTVPLNTIQKSFKAEV